MALKIEGTVEDEGKLYEWSGEFRPPKKGEKWLGNGQEVVTASGDYNACDRRFILREVKPPHDYKVGDWVRVKRECDHAGCNREHPIGAIRQVIGVYTGKVSVAGIFFLHFENIEPCDPPAPKYRPFANAEEFKPHRDRWVRLVDGDVIMRVLSYTDFPDGVHFRIATFDKATSGDELSSKFVFDDDGSPCGFLITE